MTLNRWTARSHRHLTGTSKTTTCRTRSASVRATTNTSRQWERYSAGLYDYTKSTGSLWMVVDTLRVNAEFPGQAARQLPLPFELSSLAAKSGWTLREIVIWKKDRTLPWSNGRRFRNLFEYVLFLVKTDDHKFKVDRLRDYEFGEWWLRWPERYNPNGRQPSNVWEIPIPVQGSWRTPTIPHVCPLPEELVKRMLLLSTDPGDIVFDPFAGTRRRAERRQRAGA